MVLVDVEAREQHRQLGSGHGDDAADSDQQADPGVAEASNHMSSDGDQNTAHRGRSKEHRVAEGSEHT